MVDKRLTNDALEQLRQATAAPRHDSEEPLTLPLPMATIQALVTEVIERRQNEQEKRAAAFDVANWQPRWQPKDTYDGSFVKHDHLNGVLSPTTVTTTAPGPVTMPGALDAAWQETADMINKDTGYVIAGLLEKRFAPPVEKHKERHSLKSILRQLADYLDEHDEF